MRNGTGTINPTTGFAAAYGNEGGALCRKPYAVDQISSQTVHDDHEILSNVHISRAANPIEYSEVYAYVKELEKRPHGRTERRQAHASNI